jgi:hypothetical protein
LITCQVIKTNVSNPFTAQHLPNLEKARRERAWCLGVTRILLLYNLLQKKKQKDTKTKGEMDTRVLEAELLKELFKIGAIKFGSFKLKSGIISPIYIDLRVTISYPLVLKQIADLMWKRVEGQSQFDFICGVPYTGIYSQSYTKMIFTSFAYQISLAIC